MTIDLRRYLNILVENELPRPDSFADHPHGRGAVVLLNDAQARRVHGHLHNDPMECHGGWFVHWPDFATEEEQWQGPFDDRQTAEAMMAEGPGDEPPFTIPEMIEEEFGDLIKSREEALERSRKQRAAKGFTAMSEKTPQPKETPKKH